MTINMDGMTGWVAAGAMAVAAPLAWRWVKKNVPEMLARRAGRQARLALAGAGVADPDLKELIHDVVLALVRFAEKKLPDEGMGEARMRMVLDTAESLPVVGAFVKANEEHVVAIIEEAVKKMDAEAKAVIAEPPPPPPAA